MALIDLVSYPLLMSWYYVHLGTNDPLASPFCNIYLVCISLLSLFRTRTFFFLLQDNRHQFYCANKQKIKTCYIH